jgi:hypothetical protein
MGRSRGLEPPTPGTTNQCSNQLSYDRHGFGEERFLGRRRHLGATFREGKDSEFHKDVKRKHHIRPLTCAITALATSVTQAHRFLPGEAE